MTDGTRYFELDPDKLSQQPGQFVDVDSDTPRVEFATGLSFRPVLGENVMTSFVSFEPHTEAPRHAHDEEQITIVLEGELEFDLGGETRILTKGQLAVVPSNVPHGARTHDSSCLEVDVFSPPRQALLALMQERIPPSPGGGTS